MIFDCGGLDADLRFCCQYQQFSDIPSLNAISNHDFPNFVEPVPDQFRVDVWEQDFKQAEKTGDLPNLTIIGIGNDHTGLNPADPDAEVADNDLATGRIISDISHSQFWKDSAAFVVEDDPGGYADHVDSARSPVWIASPYAKRGVVDSTYYTQVSVVKTIEQILGAQPLSQVDRAAVPMTDAFTNKPDYTPYTVVPETVPLTEGAATRVTRSPASPPPPPERAWRFGWRPTRSAREAAPGTRRQSRTGSSRCRLIHHDHGRGPSEDGVGGTTSGVAMSGRLVQYCHYGLGSAWRAAGTLPMFVQVCRN